MRLELGLWRGIHGEEVEGAGRGELRRTATAMRMDSTSAAMMDSTAASAMDDGGGGEIRLTEEKNLENWRELGEREKRHPPVSTTPETRS
jgi:hypothetical protein